MNKNFKILGAVMLGFMSFNSETLRNILQQPEQQRQLKR